MNKAIIKLLHEIIDGDLSNVDTDQGLCGNIEDRGGYDYLHVSVLEENVYDGWEYFTDSLIYPVPSSLNDDFAYPYISYDYHEANGTLYVGEQLELRQDLCKHLLSKWENEIC